MKIKINEEKFDSKNETWFIVGSIALCTMAFVVIPKVIPRVAGYVNKQCTKCKNAGKEYDDWGPLIVRREVDK
jgi:hypothetical protein